MSIDYFRSICLFSIEQVGRLGSFFWLTSDINILFFMGFNTR